MAVAKKMMGFPSDLVSFSSKLLSKRREKIRVSFITEVLKTFRAFTHLEGSFESKEETHDFCE